VVNKDYHSCTLLGRKTFLLLKSCMVKGCITSWASLLDTLLDVLVPVTQAKCVTSLQDEWNSLDRPPEGIIDQLVCYFAAKLQIIITPITTNTFRFQLFSSEVSPDQLSSSKEVNFWQMLVLD